MGIFMKKLFKNLIIELKNSQISKRKFVFQPKTKLTIALLNILWNEGFILGYKVSHLNLEFLKVFLKYKENKPVINSIKLISKPGRRLYYKVSQLWKLDSKKKLFVLSTSKGLMTIHECKKTRIGGQPLFIIK